MSSNEMVSLVLSFIIPIFIMNLISFGIGLLMEPISFKRVKKDKKKKVKDVEVEEVKDTVTEDKIEEPKEDKESEEEMKEEGS